MARRTRRPRRRPYVDLRSGGDLPPLINFAAPGGPRQTTVSRGRPVRETLPGGEFALPQVRGLRIRRGQRTQYGVRDLVVDQQGNIVAAVRGGQGAQLRMSTSGPDGGRRLVVGRGSATTGGGAAPTASGAGGAGAAPPIPGASATASGNVLWSGRVNPNRATLDRDFGAGQYEVVQENGRFVVRRKPPADPYSAYNDYPSIKNYLMGMDTTYTNFQNYLTNTYNPQITAASQALTAQRLAAGGAYNNAIQNYAGSAGNVAASITTPQVAGATGGSIVAPNQNALGAAQSMAASATAARNIDAGARTALGGLEAEKMGQSFLSSAIGYGAGLLNQYGQKRQEERLRLDQWMEEQKSKNDLALARMDQSMINSLIVSGDRAAARDVQTRGQDISADNAAADDARADAAAQDRYSTRALQLDGWLPLPKGAGTRGLNIITSNEGTKMYKPKKGGSGGGAGGGRPASSGTVNEATNAFRRGWVSQRDEDNEVTKPGAWGKNPTPEKIRAAAAFITDPARASLFPGLKKGDMSAVDRFLDQVPVTNATNRRKIKAAILQRLGRRP